MEKINRSNNEIAFFDLDKTILKINSGEILVRQAYKTGLMNRASLVKAAYLALLYKFSLRDTNKIVEAMPKWTEGLSEISISNLAKNIFNNFLKYEIRREIEAEMRNLRERNVKLVILSAAFNYICEPIADYLKLDDVICSRLEVVNGFFTGKPVGKLCFEDEKLIRINKYLNENNFKLENAAYYADAISDLPVLEQVGFPVCVYPDKKLRVIADKKDWRILK